MRLSEGYHKSVRPEQLMEIVDGAAKVIRELRTPGITHLVATGSSGQSIAWPVAYKLQMPMCIVRKPGEKSHAGLITGYGDLGNFILLDDFIGTGATVRRVLSTIDERHDELLQWDKSGSLIKPKCAGIVLYDSKRGIEPNTFEETGIPVHHHKFVDNGEWY